AIDAVMSLVHDIQLAKNENKITSVLFMNVKEVYDHVSCNQLFKICKNLGLSRSLCSWIECFMNNRYVQLAFDENKQEKTNVEIKISTATRIFHQIARLSNTERGLSFQAMRQLYIVCITSVADYEVSIWWNNQKFLLEKYQKLQNSASRKILGAFKISSYMAMELKAAIISSRARFDR